MRWLAAIVPLALAACSEAPIGAVYQHDQCHRLTLFDVNQNRAVVGAEDMARLPNGDLLVSAYDRRSTTTDGIPPEGGLYIVPKTSLKDEKVSVRSIIQSVDGGLRPHGIGVWNIDKEDAKVAVVQRTYPQGDQQTSLLTFDLDNNVPENLHSIENEEFCRANDVTWRDPETLVLTKDRSTCSGIGFYLETVLGSAKGQVLTISANTGNDQSISPLATTLAFPNGIGTKALKWPGTEEDQYVAIAETRKNQISFYPFADDTHNRWVPVTLPGSPDNITVGKPGLILAALHPNLTKLALYRYDWPLFDHAPSRIVKVTGSQVLPLFDDPTGEVFSAASIAVQTYGKLVLGSVGDDGLLVCGTEKVK